MQLSNDPLTKLMLTVFKLNGALLEAGDSLTAPLGLSSAKWQVLGALALAGEPLSVPQIARNMGLSRQAVQKQANLLYKRGLIRLDDNPRRKRSPLLTLSKQGIDVNSKIQILHEQWVSKLSAELDSKKIVSAELTLRELLSYLED